MATTPQLSTKLQSSVIKPYDVDAYRSQLSTVLGQNQSVVPNMTPIPKTTSVAPVVSTTSSVKTPAPTPATAPAMGGGSYTVAGGDSLSKIAQKNGMSLAQLLELNPQYKANPNMIQIGAKVNIAGATAPVNPANPNPAPTNLTPEQVAQQKADDLARKAGEAGYTPDQYQKMLETNNVVTKEESDKIAQELGIPIVEGELFKKPAQSSQQLYEQAYSSAGLSEVKKKIQDLNDEISRDRADLADAIGQIDENPFLTETSRVGRGKRILDQAEKKINNKLTQVTQYQTLYDQGINEINNMVTRNQNDFTTDQTINTAKLNYLQKKAEQQVSLLQGKKIKDANSSTSSYLEGASTNKSPTVIGNSESGFFKYDPTTKKFVQVVGQSAKTTAEISKIKDDIANGGSGGAGTFKPTSEQKALVGRFVNSSLSKDLGFTEADKARLQTDSNFFYWALQKANEAGVY